MGVRLGEYGKFFKIKEETDRFLFQVIHVLFQQNLKTAFNPNSDRKEEVVHVLSVDISVKHSDIVV